MNAWRKLPRIYWALIAIYSYTLWYLFFCWKHIYRAWKKHRAIVFEKQRIAPNRQLAHLVSLAVLHTIPPHFYYQYRLFRFPEKRWLDFVYTHELPHWHLMLSPNISPRSQHLMTNKLDFAAEMKRLGIPVVETAGVLSRGTKSRRELIFNRESKFIKPICGSRKQGCYQLQYLEKEDSYQLKGEDVNSLSDRTKILDFIEENMEKEPLLLQPLLTNHPALFKQSQCEALITIRLVTSLAGSEPEILSAVLEVPVRNECSRVNIYHIDELTGKLKRAECLLYDILAEENRRVNFESFQLPLWNEIRISAINSHKAFKDIQAIGWDLAITDRGVKLLEGNVNWGVSAHI
ncbi:MAG: hypothetical protein OQK51_17720 [Kangiellaceae bacterium]|nr:hypothetical protein [Kangiellaceae bacterium]